MSLYDDLPPLAPAPAPEGQSTDKPQKKIRRASFADSPSEAPVVMLPKLSTSPKSSLKSDPSLPHSSETAGVGGLFGDLPPPSASSSLYEDLPVAGSAIKSESTSCLTQNFSKHRGLAAALGEEERAQKRLKTDSHDVAPAKTELFVKKLASVFTSCVDMKKAAKACFILRDFIEKSVDSTAASAIVVPAISALFNAHSRFSDDKWLPSLCSVLEALQTKKSHFDDVTRSLIDLWTCAGCVVSRLNSSDDSFVVSKDLKFAQNLAEAIDSEESLLGRTRRWACMAVAEASFKRCRLQWMRTPIDMFFKVLRERRQHYDGPNRTRIESMLDTMKARSLQSGTLSARSPAHLVHTILKCF
jgi:predicted metal-binding protein